MQNKAVSEQFAEFVADLSYSHLTESQVYQLKTFFLDWLASAIAGQTETPVKILDTVIRNMGGVPEATVFPGLRKAPCLFAALTNGASSHVKEMDDLHRASIFHPSAAIMPAVFASAEQTHVTGKEMLAAIAAGFEVGIRIALASGPSHYRHWHTTGTCGTFGAAAGAAKVLGLNADEIAWAMGSAGTQAAGLWEFLRENAMSKQLHAGKAAFNGLLSALLAQNGFTGARHILEGPKGFFAATSAENPSDGYLDGLGSEFLFEQNSLKYYASCGHTHSAVEATVKALSTSPCNPDDIDHIRVSVYQAALDLLGTVSPDTPLAAKFNLPFCVALAVKFGHAGIDEFNETNLNDPEIKRLMACISINSDPQLSDAYPEKWPARVEIKTRTGSIFMGQVDSPKGDSENPLTREELLEKFHLLTNGLINKTLAEKLVDQAMNLESIPDVANMVNL